jgi:hypothetical protein
MPYSLESSLNEIVDTTNRSKDAMPAARSPCGTGGSNPPLSARQSQVSGVLRRLA